MDYTWDETGSKNVTFGLISPNRQTYIMFLGLRVIPISYFQGMSTTKGNNLENLFGCRENKRRYYSSHNTWGWTTNYSMVIGWMLIITCLSICMNQLKNGGRGIKVIKCDCWEK